MTTKIKLTILIAGLVITFCGGAAITILWNKYKAEKTTKERYYRNLKAESDSTKHYQTKAGQYAQEATAYEVTINELKELNKTLYKRVDDLNVKIKNIQSVTEVKTEIIYINKDSIIHTEKSQGKKTFEINKAPWISAEITITNNEYIAPTDFKFASYDSTIILPELKYKRWWIFWKKLDKVSITLANTNPYVNNNVKHYEIVK